MEPEHGTGFAADPVLVIGVAQKGKGGPVGSGGRLDDVGQEAPLPGVGLLDVEIAEILAAGAHVPAQVEVGAVGDPFEFAGSEGELVLDVGTRRCVMGQFVRFVLTQPESGAVQPEVHVPLEPAVAPIPVPVPGMLRCAEEFDFHLLEFAASKGEIAWIDFVAECLADLPDAERNFHSRRVAHGLEVDEYPLRRLRAQVRNAGSVPHRPHMGLEHEIERTGRRQGARLQGARRIGPAAQLIVLERARHGCQAVPAEVSDRSREAFAVCGGEFGFRRRAGFPGHGKQRSGVGGAAVIGAIRGYAKDSQPIGAKAVLRFPAVHHGIAEAAHVTAGFPDPGIHEYRAIQSHHVEGRGGAIGRRRIVVPAHHVFPPGVLDVSLQFHAKRAVIPTAVEPAINLAGRKYESAPLGERHQLVHRDHRRSPIAAFTGKARKYSESSTRRGCANLGRCSPYAPK